MVLAQTIRLFTTWNGMRALSPTFLSQRQNRINMAPEPANKPMTMGDLHPYSLDPHSSARRNMTVVGANSAKPVRSRSGMMLRSRANEKGGLSVSSGTCVRNSSRPDTAPMGRLM